MTHRNANQGSAVQCRRFSPCCGTLEQCTLLQTHRWKDTRHTHTQRDRMITKTGSGHTSGTLKKEGQKEGRSRASSLTTPPVRIS